MPLIITIPDSVADAIKMPGKHLADNLMLELAQALYADGALSFGKARELSGLSKYEFGQFLAKHRQVRHYSQEELKDDLIYAGYK